MKKRNNPGCASSNCCTSDEPPGCDLCDLSSKLSVDVTIPTCSVGTSSVGCSNCATLGGTYNVVRYTGGPGSFVGRSDFNLLSDNPCPESPTASGWELYYLNLRVEVQLLCYSFYSPQQLYAWVYLTLTYGRRMISNPTFTQFQTLQWLWHNTFLNALNAELVCPLNNQPIDFRQTNNTYCTFSGADAIIIP